MNGKKVCYIIMQILSVGFNVIALCSFGMPLIDYFYFTGYRLMCLTITEITGILLLLAIFCAALGILNFALSFKKPVESAKSGIISPALGMACMLGGMYFGDGFDLASIGFYVYMFAEVAALIFSIVAVATAGEGSAESIEYEYHEEYSIYRCTKCRNMNETGTHYCRFCNTPLGKASAPTLSYGTRATPISPKPLVYDSTTHHTDKVDKVNGIAFCTRCGTKRIKGTVYCTKCGTYIG